MTMPRVLAVLIVIGLTAGCAMQPSASTGTIPGATLHGDAAHPAATAGWVETRLYFGLGVIDPPGSGVSEQAWRDFLDKEVTPRFPDGLSVIDVYGQWQGKDQTSPERLRSKQLVIDYEDTPEHRAKVEAIRAAWKKRTGDQSVLRVTQPADVSF